MRYWTSLGLSGCQYSSKIVLKGDMLMKFRNSLKRYRAVPATVLGGCLSLGVPCFAYAADASGGAAGMSSLLASFTEVAAWMWSEIGLLLAWILNQPILLLSMSLFFIGAIVAFFMRVFHSV